MPEVILDAATVGNGQPGAFVQQATDPTQVAANVVTPADFAAQFATPLDQTELLAMCEEVNMLRAIPEYNTNLKTYSWREMTSLAFTSGSSKRTFADGVCPEEFVHDGGNKSIDLKNVGAKKSLTLSDIKHSLGSIQAGYGINRLMGGWDGSEGLPGGATAPSLTLAPIADLKAKEMKLASVLTLNALDTLLVVGDSVGNALEFDGFENYIVTGSGAHGNTDITGAFSANRFDRFLAEGCAKPTHIYGHPAAIQEMMSAYFQLGYSGSQVIQFTGPAGQIVPGMNFAGEINTGVGRLIVISDVNFTRTNTGGSTFQSTLFPVRMTHNGEPLIYRLNQFPLSFTDLVPGCTAISFEIWTKTALIIKAMCAQNRFTAIFNGILATTCVRVGI